jgi:L-gulonate 5-dehydrogenase
MKAILAAEPYHVRWAEVETPQIEEPTDVRIRVKAVGVCGSDIHISHGTNVYATYPRVLGHEIAGEVESVGGGVTTLKISDKVVLEPIKYCGKCYACVNGHPNVCQNLQVYGVHRDGGFAEYLVADERNFHKVPDDLSFEHAAMVEPYTIGAQCTWRGDVRKGDVVLVHGAGPIGLIAADVSKNLGAATVIVSEINEYRLNAARQFGADHLVNPAKQDLKAALDEITGGMGPNVILEAAGVPALLSQSVELASVAGRVVALGFGQEPIPINFALVNKKELGIYGTRLQSYKFKPVIEGFSRYRESVRALITATYPASDFQRAFDDFSDKNSKVLKVVLTF